MVLYEGVTTVLLGPKSKPRWAAFINCLIVGAITVMKSCFLMPLPAHSHFKEVLSHPCGVTQGNFVWLVEQLYGVKAILHLMKITSRFADLLGFIEKQPYELQHVGDLVSAFRKRFDELEMLEEVDKIGCPTAAVTSLATDVAPSDVSTKEASSHSNLSNNLNRVGQTSLSGAHDTDSDHQGEMITVGKVDTSEPRENAAPESDSIFMVEDNDPFFGTALTSDLFDGNARESCATEDARETRSVSKTPLPHPRATAILRNRLPFSNRHNMGPPVGLGVRSHRPVDFAEDENIASAKRVRHAHADMSEDESQQVIYSDEKIERNAFL